MEATTKRQWMNLGLFISIKLLFLFVVLPAAIRAVAKEAQK
jgi:ABC-type multidrug transport system permease subunit